jgi:hypothetical protein
MNWKATLLAKFRSHLKLDYFDYIRVAESYGVQVSQVMEILTPSVKDYTQDWMGEKCRVNDQVLRSNGIPSANQLML